MRATRLNPDEQAFNYPVRCTQCGSADTLGGEHDFDSDPKRIFEVIYCIHCGTNIEETDVTEHYQLAAEFFADLALEDELERTRNDDE